MTAKPTALGYIVLAGFVGAGVYAFTRKSKASDKTCPIDARRVEHFGVALQTSVVWAYDHTEPPQATVAANGEIVFPGAPGKTYPAPVIVITAGREFWRYNGDPNTTVVPQPAPDALEAYCALG